MRLHHAGARQCLALRAVGKQQKFLLNEILKNSFCTSLKLTSVALSGRTNHRLKEHER